METTLERTTEIRHDMSEYFAYWKSLTHNNAKIPSHFFLLHDIILGRDPKKVSFSPITNKNKLNNGMKRWKGLEAAINRLVYSLKHEKDSKLVELSGVGSTTIEKFKYIRYDNES